MPVLGSVQIEDGEINANINQRDGMVEFKEDPELYNSNKTMQQLNETIQRCIVLSTKVKEVDDVISLTPQYIFKVVPCAVWRTVFKRSLQTEIGSKGGGGGGGGDIWEDDAMGGFEDMSMIAGPGGSRKRERRN